jgi:peptide/nickel transport system substrate-binding protein
MGISLFLFLVAAFLLGAVAFAGGSSPELRNGGTFRASVSAGAFDYIDPALAYTEISVALLDTTCARLFNYPDKSLPQGFRAVPEVAAGYPRITHDGKTFTFTLRSGFRFSNGAPVKATAFAHQINRLLDPAIQSPGLQYVQDIVGAGDVIAGRTTSARGVVAKGNRLVVSFTKPVPDFPARTTMPFFCAVPPTLPADPEGVGAFAGSGPYHIVEFVRGRRIVLRRNRFYRGGRPHHVDGFEFDLTAGSVDDLVTRTEDARIDWGTGQAAPLYFDPALRLVAKYGVNRSRFFVKPGLTLKFFAFNTSRPLFRNNPSLRRAVNFAVDRAEIRGLTPGGSLVSSPTDQYLPSGMPGFHNAQIYPSRPNVGRAKALARGHIRGGKVVIYTFAGGASFTFGQVLKRNLAQIGLDAQVKGLPSTGYFDRLDAPNEPWDLAFSLWVPDYVDPYAYLNTLLDGRFVGTFNISRFDSPTYNRLLRRTARLRGGARYVAYGKLDVRLVREAAPMIALGFGNEVTLVSKRVDRRCIVLRPTLDLTAVCLK